MRKKDTNSLRGTQREKRGDEGRMVSDGKKARGDLKLRQLAYRIHPCLERNGLSPPLAYSSAVSLPSLSSAKSSTPLGASLLPPSLPSPSAPQHFLRLESLESYPKWLSSRIPKLGVTPACMYRIVIGIGVQE